MKNTIGFDWLCFLKNTLPARRDFPLISARSLFSGVL